jgi:hypothetical protein
MEKLMYLTWLGQESTRSDVAEVMLARVGEELLALDPVALGSRERYSGPGPHSGG